MSKPLTDLEWIALARARNDERPALAGIHVDGDRKVIEATDGHRIHYVKHESTNLRSGLYQYLAKNGVPAGLGELIDARFPNTGYVIPERKWDLQLKDALEASAVCAMAIAYARASGSPPLVSLMAKGVNGDFLAALNPHYLADILKGYATRAGFGPFCLSAPHPLHPLTFRGFGDGGGCREAVLMPVRVAGVDSRFAIEVLPV